MQARGTMSRIIARRPAEDTHGRIFMDAKCLRHHVVSGVVRAGTHVVVASINRNARFEGGMINPVVLSLAG